MTFGLVFEQLLNGLQFGVTLFLMAAGLTLVVGIMNFINLAHGSLYMVGAYLALAAARWTGSYLAGVGLGLAGTLLVGMLVEVVALRTLYQRDHLDQVLATFGLILFFNELIAIVWGRAALFASPPDFLKGHIEAIPLPADSIDVVISNCVVNLAADKPAVFAEIARVLRPGGRIGITDIVADDALTPAERAERGSYAGCIAGALSVSEMTDGLTAAGLTDVSVQPTHEAAPGMYSAIIRAAKPLPARRGSPT